MRNSPQFQQIANDDFIQAKENIPDYITGLSYRLNQTIGFLRLDKRFSGYFIKLWKHPGNSNIIPDLIALISNENERIYWMQEKMINRFC